MNQRTGANLAASIRQRLLNKARETDRPFNEMLQYFVVTFSMVTSGMSSGISKVWRTAGLASQDIETSIC